MPKKTELSDLQDRLMDQAEGRMAFNPFDIRKAVSALKQFERECVNIPEVADIRIRIVERLDVHVAAVTHNKHKPRAKQKHLDCGSEAQAYWQHGYLMALVDVLNLIPETNGKTN